MLTLFHHRGLLFISPIWWKQCMCSGLVKLKVDMCNVEKLFKFVIKNKFFQTSGKVSQKNWQIFFQKVSLLQ